MDGPDIFKFPSKAPGNKINLLKKYMVGFHIFGG
jgi:hypothetical protein